MYINIMLLAFCLCLFCVCNIYGQQFNEDDFEFVKTVHRSFCGTSSLCTNPEKDLTDNTTTTRSLGDLPFSVVPSDSGEVLTQSRCCQSCSCNTSICVDFGTCCPDILDRIPTVEEAQQPHMVSCQNMSVRDIGHVYTFWVYGLCSKGYVVGDNQTATEIKSKCESLDTYFDIDTRVPVTDPATQRLYANKFCALCNFAREVSLIPLIPRLACFEGDLFSKNVDRNTLIRDLYETRLCDIDFSWPVDRVDYSPPVCRQMKTRCNMTGLWKRYDPLIEAACHTYRAPYDYTYNNIFCHICNEEAGKAEDNCIESGGRGIGILSFAAILDFSQENIPMTDVAVQCSESQVYDHYKGVCRELRCIFPRILQGGQCVNIGDRVTEVAYNLQLKFQAIEVYKSQELNYMVPLVTAHALKLLTSWASLDAAFEFNMFYKIAFISVNSKELNHTMENTTGGTHPLFAIRDPDNVVDKEKHTTQHIEEVTESSKNVLPNNVGTPQRPGHISPPSIEQPVPQNNVLTAALSVSFILWQVKWYFIPRISGYHSKDFVDNVLDVDETNITLNDPANGKTFSFRLHVTDYDAGPFGFPVDPEGNTLLPSIPVNVNLPKASQLQPVYPPVRRLEQSLICPLLELDSDEFTITDSGEGIVVEELNTTFDKKVYKKEFGDQNISVYQICKDAYISITDRYVKNKTILHLSKGVVTPQGVLSVVCACISIICSFFTLLTYLLFRELRTQPGINNMFLCVYLICAQVFFTFATPQEDSVSGWACSLIGALTHFFWLMVVFAMNVCCYHMFTVFNSQSRNRNRSDSKFAKSIMYTAYCVGSSVLFIAINIIVVFVDTDKEQTGYGDGLCYISRPEMVGYIFALPVGIILSINIVFFVTVVVRISRSPTVSSSNKKDRNYFKIYAKISSVTGLSWIFGFLFQFTGHVVFEYIFIILNGGIGVLIFLSFMINRRVYKLYTGLFVGNTRIVENVHSKDTTEHTSNSNGTELSSLSKTSPFSAL